MASIRRRSLRRLGNYVNGLDRRVRRMSRRPAPTRVADRSVGAPQLEEGAVTPAILSPTVVASIEDAQTTADDAQTTADGAQTTADGKNKIYRQTSAPAGTSHATGDLWFDTDDGNKFYRWTGSAWGGFELGDSAIASISATKITAGSLDASVIVTSNLDAGQITTGSLSANRISGGSINSIDYVSINSGIQTSINVPYTVTSTLYTFIVQEVSQPLHAVRIAPGKVIVTNPDHGISLDMTNGIFSTLPIYSNGTITGANIYASGSGVTFKAEGTGYFSDVSNLYKDFYGVGLGYTNGAPGSGFYVIANNDASAQGRITTTVPSDRRYKSNIEDVSSEENNKIYSLVPRQYILKDNYPFSALRGEKRVGLIADEVEGILPDVVLIPPIERHIVHDWSVDGHVLTQEQMELYGGGPDAYEFTNDGVYKTAEYSQVDYSALVPRLVSTIIDLNNRLTMLEFQP